MTTQLTRQQDMPSMVRNGTFGSGLAAWLASPGVVHAELPSDTVATASLINSPRFLARIPAGGHIRQVVGSSDAFSFPSRRYVELLDAVPIGIDTLDLRPTGLTTVDGIPYTSGIDPFSFEDAEPGRIVMRPGTQVEVDDLHREQLSGPYRIGRALISDEGTALELNSIQASPINGTIAKLATSAEFLGTTYTYDDAGTQAVIEVVGINEFDRQREGSSLTGFQPNDVIIITGPDFRVARVIQVSREVDRYQLTVVAVEHAPFLAGTNSATGVATQALTEWFVSPITQVSLIRELPVYQYDITLAYSYTPNTHDGVPKLDFVNRAGKVVQSIPRHVLENGAFQEDLSVAESPEFATIFRRRLVRFFAEFRQPVGGQLRVSLFAGQIETDIGDVVLAKGNFTRRHDFDDRDDPTISVVADRRSALDRLLHGVDEAAGIIPRGTVILYTGGAVCPPGYRRVDALPLSTRDGLETIPAPDATAFDAGRNRTIMVWDNQSFDLLDRFGNQIPIEGDSEDIQVTLPPQAPFNSAFEIIQVGPVQQRIQPGMALRIRFSDVDTEEARRFDYSSIVRQALVERTEVSGDSGGVTYPVFMSDSQFDPEEVNFSPIGPPSNAQPTSYSGTSTAPFGQPNGSQANPAPFSGLTPGGQLMTITGVQLAPLAVDELVYIRWTSGSGFNQNSGAFIGRVVSNDNAGNIAVERADGNGMVVSGSTTPVTGTASISDALVFGSDVVVTRTNIGTTAVWSARRFMSSFKLTVFGDVTGDVLNYNQGGIVVEPAGFLRYGKRGTNKPFDYGTMGHSHKITQGDAPANTNIAPHVNLSFESLPPSSVAYEHGHGFFPKFIFPIPEYVAYLLCERL